MSLVAGRRLMLLAGGVVAVAVGAALVLSGLPSGTGVLVAGPLGMAAGAAAEAWQSRRRVRRSG